MELNVTFYRLPSIKAFEGWRRKTPKELRFAVKGNRFITHIKRLKDKKGLAYIESYLKDRERYLCGGAAFRW